MTMNKRILQAGVLAAVSVMALGACSSGASEPEQSDREAAPTAAESPTNQVTMPASGATPFKDVTMTRNPDAKCDRKDSATEAKIVCTNVPKNFFGNAVYVRVPNDSFKIKVENDTPNKVGIVSSLHNTIYREKDSSKDNVKFWDIPDDTEGWGVGADSQNDKIHAAVTLTVTKKL